MPFDWISFLEGRSISYVTRGSNVSRGRVAIPCPFCLDDPSQHMTINLAGAGWGCWRNRAHSGRNPARLVQALLRCSRQQAETIVFGAPQIGNDFEAQLMAMMSNKPAAEYLPPRPLPKEFHRFKGKPSQLPFINYLIRRGFRPPGNYHLNLFDIHYCLEGEFAYRIIFPLRVKGGYLAWTGRTISPTDKLRYKTDGPIGKALPWINTLRHSNCHTIVLVEGPFDAFKINVLGKGEICSTCFFTNTPSTQQFDQLYELLPRFRHRYIMLDRDMLWRALELSNRLASFGVQVKPLPHGVKDPGELSNDHMKLLFA